MLDTRFGHFHDAGYSRFGHALATPEARQAALVEPAEVSLFVRFWRGMADHFRLRASSWIMSANMFGFGVIILSDPTVLDRPGISQIYATLLRVADPLTWGWVCLSLGLFRLAALVINGTFPKFTLSPYMRAAGSFLSALFWLQIVLGAVHSEHLMLALAMFPTFLALDAYCLYVAALEIEPHGEGAA